VVGSKIETWAFFPAFKKNPLLVGLKPLTIISDCVATPFIFPV